MTAVTSPFRAYSLATTIFFVFYMVAVFPSFQTHSQGFFRPYYIPRERPWEQGCLTLRVVMCLVPNPLKVSGRGGRNFPRNQEMTNRRSKASQETVSLY